MKLYLTDEEVKKILAEYLYNEMNVDKATVEIFHGDDLRPPEFTAEFNPNEE